VKDTKNGKIWHRDRDRNRREKIEKTKEGE
jgi:hypothetical protein